MCSHGAQRALGQLPCVVRSSAACLCAGASLSSAALARCLFSGWPSLRRPDKHAPQAPCLFASLSVFAAVRLCSPARGIVSRALLDWDKLKMGDMKAQCLAPPRAVIGPEHGCMAPSMSARPRGQGRAGKLAPHALSWPNASPLTRNASPPRAMTNPEHGCMPPERYKGLSLVWLNRHCGQSPVFRLRKTRHMAFTGLRNLDTFAGHGNTRS